MSSVRSHISSVDFHRHALADQLDRQHEARVRALSHQPPNDAAQGTVDDFDQHALLDERTRVEQKIGLNQAANGVYLTSGNRCGDSVERDDAHDARALEHGHPVGGLKTREAISGEERPVDLLLAILPAAPARNRRQKRVEAFLLELLPDHLLVP